jgi:DNA-binding LytR/AlgR family response regulator
MPGMKRFLPALSPRPLRFSRIAISHFDLLFTDLALRDHIDGGLDVGDAARKARPGLPVVYTTGRKVTEGKMKRFVEPNRFVAKPYTNEHLRAAVADLLDNKRA